MYVKEPLLLKKPCSLNRNPDFICFIAFLYFRSVGFPWKFKKLCFADGIHLQLRDSSDHFYFYFILFFWDGSYLHSDFRQVHLERQLLPAVHVRVVGLLEGSLQLVELEGGEGGPVAAVLLLGVLVVRQLGVPVRGVRAQRRVRGAVGATRTCWRWAVTRKKTNKTKNRTWIKSCRQVERVTVALFLGSFTSALIKSVCQTLK